MTLPDMSS
jgi:hypothetical protein